VKPPALRLRLEIIARRNRRGALDDLDVQGLRLNLPLHPLMECALIAEHHRIPEHHRRHRRERLLGLALHNLLDGREGRRSEIRGAGPIAVGMLLLDLVIDSLAEGDDQLRKPLLEAALRGILFFVLHMI